MLPTCVLYVVTASGADIDDDDDDGGPVHRGSMRDVVSASSSTASPSAFAVPCTSATPTSA